jgi:hypothetical protein
MKNRFQSVDFHDVEEFLDYLPEKDRKIVDKLRKLVLECLPGCKEKLAYNVPYYYLNSRVCFIWPGVVQWGTPRREGVELGFCRGHLMADERDYLEKGNRKEVYMKTFHDVKDIDAELLKQYIYEAAFVDEQAAKKKA